MARHRLLFSKTGRAQYLSHLDLMRTMQRVFQRAGVGIRHTEGFNPHAYISVALPLSVGVESVCELLDFELVDGTPLETLPTLLTAHMPEGIEVLAAYEAERKVKDIVWLRLSGVLEYDDISSRGDLVAPLREFFAREQILVTKLTKKKEKTEIDIAPLLRDLAIFIGRVPGEETPRVFVGATVAAQNPSVSPSLLLEALGQNAPELVPDFAQFSREELYDKDMAVFR